MKRLKQSILFLLTFLFIFLILNGILEGFTYLFAFPLLALTIFLALYIFKQTQQQETEQRLTKGIRYALEEKQADAWLRTDFVPKTLVFITTQQWIIILYTFLFLAGLGFVWSYLINGFWQALQDVTYALLLFWLVIGYLFLSRFLGGMFINIIPKKLHQILHNDWVHGFFLLLPISFLLYLLVPFETIQQTFQTKILGFSTFVVVYSSFFLCLYALVSLNRLLHQEDEKKLQEAIRKELEEK